MDKRTLLREIIIFVIALHTISLGISEPSSLVVIPHGTIPERGQVEYGIRSKLFANSDDKLKSGTEAFYYASLTNKFQIGLKTTEEIDILLSMKAQIGSLEFWETNHKIVIGMHNLGLTNRYWKDNAWQSIPQTSLPKVRSYAIYTIEIPKLRSFYHVGVSEFDSFEDEYIIAGAHYDFKQFRTTAEWDGKQVHFGLLFKLPNNVKLYGALTPIPNKEGNRDRHFISIAFTHKGKLFKEKNKKELDMIKEDYKKIKSQLAVLDAKTDVIREFSSLDFLEEFQQFLLQEHMVKDELDTVRKTEIRLALEHMQRGLEFYYKEEYKLSLKEYEIVTTLVPSFSIAYARLGSIYYKLGDLDKAKNSWEQALELDPSNDSLKLFLKRITPPKKTDKSKDVEKKVDMSEDYKTLKIIPENDQT